MGDEVGYTAARTLRLSVGHVMCDISPEGERVSEQRCAHLQRQCPGGLPEAGAFCFGVGHYLGDDGPEGGRVVAHGEVGELVDDDVVDEIGLERHDTPAKAQRAVGGATGPPAALVSDHNAGLLAAPQSRPPVVDELCQPFCGARGVPGIDGAQDFGVALPFRQV